MKRKITTVILFIVFFAGMSLLLYPSIANFWNENFAAKAVTEYAHRIAAISEEEYTAMWDAAIAYNQGLSEATSPIAFSQSHAEDYADCLNADGSSIMGYIEIPKLDVLLPLYHGTGTEALAVAAGHLDWTSLPTGGPGTHCCISGHRGLASAKLFSDLDLLREGDTFTITVLHQVLTYEVDQIRIVLPNQIDDLYIVPEQDYCTLVTCTPYGVNTHRLLVRGHRIANAVADARVISEAVIIDDNLVASLLAVPILIGLFVTVLCRKPKKKTKRENGNR